MWILQLAPGVVPDSCTIQPQNTATIAVLLGFDSRRSGHDLFVVDLDAALAADTEFRTTDKGR